MQGTSCTAAGCNGEVFLSSFYALFLVGTSYRMLETGRVGGVSGDGNIYVLSPHDRNAFANIVCTIAVYFCTRSIGVCLAEYFFQLACVVIIFCFDISKSVDTCDDLSSVFSKTVQDNTQRFLTYTVCFFSDTDRALSSSEGLVTCQECEALGILFQKHFAQVSMSQTYFTLVCYRTRNTEGLKSLTDCSCSLRCFAAAFFDRDCSAYGVSPFCVFEADRLNAFYHFVYIQTCSFCYFCSFLDGIDSVLS